MILTGDGDHLGVIPRMSHKPIFGYKANRPVDRRDRFLPRRVGSPLFHDRHLDLRAPSFMSYTLAIAVPKRHQIFNWIATMWGGANRTQGADALRDRLRHDVRDRRDQRRVQAADPLDYPLQDTYWVVAHLHYVLFGGNDPRVSAGFYFWFFPRMSRRMYSNASPAGISPSR